MRKLTNEMRQLVERQRLGFVATVCQMARRTYLPKGLFASLTMTTSSSPTFVRGTVANLRTNPNIELNVVDHFVRKGYRFKGTAQVLDAGPDFANYIKFFSNRGMLDAPSRIRAIVIVQVGNQFSKQA